MTYTAELIEAIRFTRELGYAPDSDASGADDSRLRSAVDEMANGGLDEQIRKSYVDRGDDPYIKLGGDCANVHSLMPPFLTRYYPELRPNFVIGAVKVATDEGFAFSREKFQQWLQRGYGELFDAHAWVAIGSELIIDVTIGTWVLTRMDKQGGAFGGIHYGRPDKLLCAPIANHKHMGVKLDTIQYKPIAVGLAAFKRVVAAGCMH